ncbi:MAG: L-fucose:H+ symporter permease [Bacteroidota bacterium]
MIQKDKLVERKYLIPFILVTSLFAMWGFANDITNPLVAAFKTLMEMTNAKAALIQLAFYGGYGTMAIPAALFVRKYDYKKGILLGLAFYATGALLFWPAAHYQAYIFFLIALYILTFGLAFLETTANPFILSLGSKSNATRRLNLAQSFNPVGSITGMAVASWVILDALQSDERINGILTFPMKDEVTKAAIRANDLIIIRDPYVALGIVVIMLFVLIAISKMPQTGHTENGKALESMKRLAKNRVFREGVVAQLFYVGAQILCWTFIIHYADNLGIDKSTAQKYNMVAMGMFLTFRFVSTMLMKYVNARKLLMFFALGGMATITGVILIEGMMGLYLLIATSGFMSLMFPTIYGIALRDVGDDASMGAAFLVMAIVGGALLPVVQGAIIDLGTVGPLPAVNFSFIVPFISFVVIAIYGRRSYLADNGDTE